MTIKMYFQLFTIFLKVLELFEINKIHQATMRIYVGNIFDFILQQLDELH